MYLFPPRKSRSPNSPVPAKLVQATPVIQPKLTVNEPGDAYEQEADATADRVMRMPDGGGSRISAAGGLPGELQRKCAHCEEEEKVQRTCAHCEEEEDAGHVQRKEAGGGAPEVSSAVHKTLGASGQPLDRPTRTFMEQRFGHDFGNVKIHNDGVAQRSAGEINALAYTSRNNVVFGSGQYAPHSANGRKLLAHELTHVVQQSGSSGKIQRAVDIDDVADEMNGKQFELTADETPLTAGAHVVIKSWNGTSKDAVVDYIANGVKTTLSIPKYKLKPATASAAGVRHYDTGVGAQSTAVKDSLKSVADQGAAVADWKAKEGSYKKNHAVWQASLGRLEAELQRRQGLADAKEKTMSRTLVKEEMYNRFDTLIKKWVDHYNAALAPATNLDSNMVKSILYRESRMGTSGFHLQLGPYSWSDVDHHPIKSRFNIGQTIDSWPQQQYVMIKEMSPAIYAKYKLNDLEKGAKWKGLTQQEATTSWNGGALFKAAQEFSMTKDAAGKNLMGNAPDLAEDYEFWIRTCIHWLFIKYKSLATPSWPAAIKAFNGAGLAAENYKNDVMSRVGSNTNISVQ